MISSRTGARWLAAAALTAMAAAVSGCSGQIDAGELPGVYRNDETGGEIRLEDDGTFSATGITETEYRGDGSTAPADFGGTWEFVDAAASTDFVYLEFGGGEVQLYATDQETLEFIPDPDAPPTLTLDKA